MNSVDINVARDSLERHGYFLFENFLNECEIQAITDLGNFLEKLPEVVGGPMKYFEKNDDSCDLLNRVENFIHKNERIENTIFTTSFPDLLRSFSSKEFFLFKEKINFKMSGGNGFKPHQDAPAFTRFVKSEMFTVMVPLQETNLENGCLQVSENYFEKQILQHIDGVVKTENKPIQWKHIPMNKGDVLVFSSMLIHQSDQNKTNESRRAYFATYNAGEEGDLREDYFQFKRENFPPRIERGAQISVSDWNKRIANKVF